MEIPAEGANIRRQSRICFQRVEENAFHLFTDQALSPFTTLRHSAIRRLHGSWQNNGTVAASLCEARASPAGRRLQAAITWSYTGSNFSFGNFVDAIIPSRSRF